MRTRGAGDAGGGGEDEARRRAVPRRLNKKVLRRISAPATECVRIVRAAERFHNLDDLTPLRQLDPDLLEREAALFAPRPAVRFRDREPAVGSRRAVRRDLERALEQASLFLNGRGVQRDVRRSWRAARSARRWW